MSDAGMRRLRDVTTKLRQEKRDLAAALMDMVDQNFDHHTDGTVSHSFMGTEEATILTLEDLGLAERVATNRYRLLYDKLHEI